MLCVIENCSCVEVTDVSVKVEFRNVSPPVKLISKTSRPLMNPAVIGLLDIVRVATFDVMLAAVVVRPVPRQTCAVPE